MFVLFLVLGKLRFGKGRQSALVRVHSLTEFEQVWGVFEVYSALLELVWQKHGEELFSDEEECATSC